MTGVPDDSNLTIARQELDILAKIIERKENVRLRQRNWLITIVAGLGLAYLSSDSRLSRAHFLLLVVFIVVIFWATETIYQNVEDRAIARFRDVERVLRDGHAYIGPKISESLAPPGLRQQLEYLRRTMFAPRVASPFNCGCQPLLVKSGSIGLS